MQREPRMTKTLQKGRCLGRKSEAFKNEHSYPEKRYTINFCHFRRAGTLNQPNSKNQCVIAIMQAEKGSQNDWHRKQRWDRWTENRWPLRTLCASLSKQHAQGHLVARSSLHLKYGSDLKEDRFRGKFRNATFPNIWLASISSGRAPMGPSELPNKKQVMRNRRRRPILSRPASFTLSLSQLRATSIRAPFQLGRTIGCQNLNFLINVMQCTSRGSRRRTVSGTIMAYSRLPWKCHDVAGSRTRTKPTSDVVSGTSISARNRSKPVFVLRPEWDMEPYWCALVFIIVIPSPEIVRAYFRTDIGLPCCPLVNFLNYTCLSVAQESPKLRCCLLLSSKALFTVRSASYLQVSLGGPVLCDFELFSGKDQPATAPLEWPENREVIFIRNESKVQSRNNLYFAINMLSFCLSQWVSVQCLWELFILTFEFGLIAGEYICPLSAASISRIIDNFCRYRASCISVWFCWQKSQTGKNRWPNLKTHPGRRSAQR